jgi:hypothetical protein
MKRQGHSTLALVLLAALVGGLGWQGTAAAQTAAQKEDQKGSSTKHGDAAKVASVLMGTYQLQGEGSDVRLQIESSGGTADSGNLLATLSGQLQGRDLNQQGIIHLDNQGSQVLMSLTPRLTQGPEAAAKPAGQVSSTEMQAACNLYLQPSGMGWTGTTQDPGNCVKALGMANQQVGQWQLQVLTGELRVTDATSKQTLVFQKTSDSGKAGQ